MTDIEAMLVEARAEVSQADHKASMVLTALGVGFGALLAGTLAGGWEPGYLTGVAEALWWIGAVAALAAVLAASLAVWPRWNASDAGEGIYYWGHVATFETIGDLAEAISEHESGDGNRTLHQLWRLSLIVKRKYMLIRCALGCSWGAAILFLVASLAG